MPIFTTSRMAKPFKRTRTQQALDQNFTHEEWEISK